MIFTWQVINQKEENLINVHLKENSGTKSTFGLITHWYLVNRSLRFVVMIIECKEFYL